MSWNPFKFQYTAFYRGEENDQAILELHKGTQTELIHFPKQLLAPGLKIGDSFTLRIEDDETARSNEAETMKKLLSELIQ
ncbi:MAG: hypothetical protein WC777_04710 [Candidatus Gracilibacteria bacterium]|jgi:hypothetical protein